MSDPFNSLMTTGAANAVGGMANLFAGSQAMQLQANAGAQNANTGLMQYMMGQDVLSAQNREQSRQFDIQTRERSDLIAAKREESAFARLNAYLDSQLKRAEIESRDRQLAFENTLKLQQNDLQMKIQTMQVERMESVMDAEALRGELASISVDAAELNGLDLADRLVRVKNKHKRGMAYLESSGTPIGQTIAGMVTAAKQMKLDLPVLDDDLLGDSFTVEAAQKAIEDMDLAAGRVKADDKQVLGYVKNQLLNKYTNEDAMAARIGDYIARHGIKGSKLATLDAAGKTRLGMLAALEDMEASGGGPLQPHYAKIKAQLSDPVGAAHFDTLYRAGVLEPIKDKATLSKLQMLHQHNFQTQVANMQAAADRGFNYFGPELKEARERAEEQFQEARMEIMAGGRPDAVWALSGGVDSFDSFREGVLTDIKKTDEFKRVTGGDIMDFALEVSGLAGAGRFVSNFFTGRWDKLSVGDAVDLALTSAALFSGGATLWGRGLLGASKGVKATMLGAKVAKGGGVLGGLGRGATYVPKAIVRKAGLGTRKMQLWAAKGSTGADAVRRASNAIASANRWLANQTVAAGSAGMQVPWRVSAALSNLAGKEAALSAARTLRGGEVAANIAAAGWAGGRAADMAIGRASEGYERGQSGPRLSFGRFHEAADKLEDSFQTLRMMGDKTRGKQLEALTTEFVSSFENFKNVAGSYYSDGRVPFQIEERYLQLSRLLPPLIANKINRRIRDGDAGVQPRSFSSFEEMMALPARGGGVSMPVAAPAGGAASPFAGFE
jgi:hypothetical protein